MSCLACLGLSFCLSSGASAPEVLQARQAPAGQVLAINTGPSGKDNMDPRLLVHFVDAGVRDEIIEKLSTACVKSLSLFASLGGSGEGFRTFLERPGIDVKAASLMTSVEQATMVAAWRAANSGS